MSATEFAARLGVRALRSARLRGVPSRLYRARMGFVFGTRLLLLEYTGQRSGVLESIILSVIDRPAPGEYVVASWSGAGGRWYRDVQADPHVRISTGTDCGVAATAIALSQGQCGGALGHYIYTDPVGWQRTKSAIEIVTGRPVDTLTMVKFRIGRFG